MKKLLVILLTLGSLSIFAQSLPNPGGLSRAGIGTQPLPSGSVVAGESYFEQSEAYEFIVEELEKQTLVCSKLKIKHKGYLVFLAKSTCYRKAAPSILYKMFIKFQPAEPFSTKYNLLSIDFKEKCF